MDILYIGTLPPHQGGSAVANVQILRGLEQRGHAFRCIAPITESTLANGDGFAEQNPGLGVRRYMVPYFDTSPDIPAAAAYRTRERAQIVPLVADAVANKPPDVVISGRESFAWHVPELARAHGLPCLQIFHDVTLSGILNGSYSTLLAQQLLGRLRGADRAVTASHHLAATLRRLEVPNVEVVPNPVDLALFRPQPKDEALLRRLGLKPDTIVVCHISNLKALKRVDDLIAAAELLAGTDLPISCLIVGNGPGRSELEGAVAAKGLTGTIRFLDWVEHEQLPAYLSVADLVVMPSACEAQPLVYLETQACGRTLIASDIAAAREILVDGENAILFETGDPVDLAEKIRAAAADPGLRATIGLKARESVRAHSLEGAVERYEQLLSQLVAQPPIAEFALSHHTC